MFPEFRKSFYGKTEIQIRKISHEEDSRDCADNKLIYSRMSAQAERCRKILTLILERNICNCDNFVLVLTCGVMIN